MLIVVANLAQTCIAFAKHLVASDPTVRVNYEAVVA